MNNKTILIFILAVFIIQGCVPGPHTSIYKPSDAESSFFYKADKRIYPSDIRKEFNEYKGAKVHWIGIIREQNIVQHDGHHFLKLKIEQKYWDYLEDFSLQRERIFLSPLGEGNFYFVGGIDSSHLDEISKVAAPPNLAIIYGTVVELEDGDPKILGDYMKFIDEQYYATNIFKYSIVRDSSGKVVLSKNGFPRLEEFSIIMHPRRGRNQKKEEK